MRLVHVFGSNPSQNNSGRGDSLHLLKDYCWAWLTRAARPCLVLNRIILGVTIHFISAGVLGSYVRLVHVLLGLEPHPKNNSGRGDSFHFCWGVSGEAHTCRLVCLGS
jgi:hypothetical protein